MPHHQACRRLLAGIPTPGKTPLPCLRQRTGASHGGATKRSGWRPRDWPTELIDMPTCKICREPAAAMASPRVGRRFKRLAAQCSLLNESSFTRVKLGCKLFRQVPTQGLASHPVEGARGISLTCADSEAPADGSFTFERSVVYQCGFRLAVRSRTRRLNPTTTVASDARRVTPTL